MKNKKIKKRKKPQKKSNLLSKFLGLFTIVAFLTLGIYYFTSSNNQIISRIAQEDVARENLQLGTFTPTPKPKEETGGACNHDNGLPAQMNDGKPVDDATCSCEATLIKCEDKRCVDVNEENSAWPEITCDLANSYGWCGIESLAPTDGWYCLGKPVIYLYPEKPTYVDVKVETQGKVFVSDPQIEEGNKWTKVFAEPSGKLTYNKKTYRELFYETDIKEVKKPSKGLTINSKNVRAELDEVISKLGLIKDEKTEFLDYWVPRLENLKSRYIFFGVIERDEKDRIDKVIIDPKPDTFIEFIAYFSPLDEPYEGEILELPSTPPKRIGFTAVEWGGTIGK